MTAFAFTFGAACLVAVLCLALKFHRDNQKQP